MSVYFAEFIVQRDGVQYTCRGDKLFDRVRNLDLFAIHRDGTLWRGTKDKLRDSDYLV